VVGEEPQETSISISFGVRPAGVSILKREVKGVVDVPGFERCSKQELWIKSLK
jgi:hypothetical protein